jgi:hypothetical protein
MVVGILVALFLGVVVAFTVGILNHQLDKWVEENPRPVNSICDMSIPIPPSKQWGDFTDEQSTTKEEYTECYPSHVGRSINVWHTVYGTGRSVKASYAVSDSNESDYPYFFGSSTTATPQRIWVYTGSCSSNNQLDELYNEKGNVTFPTDENEVYYVYIVGYGGSDAYSTQDFCVKVQYLDE